MKKAVLNYLVIAALAVAAVCTSCNKDRGNAVKSIRLIPGELILEVGETETLKTVFHPSDPVNWRRTWESDNPAVATVEKGVVTAVATGTATITAITDDGRHTATCTVSVIRNATDLWLNWKGMVLTPGETKFVTATLSPADATDKITWSSDNTNAVIVENGHVTAVAAGIANITAATADGGYKATCTVLVHIPRNPEIEMIFVEGGTFTMGSPKIPYNHSFESGFGDERPEHQVTLSSFSIGKYEVTQGQWEDIMGINPGYDYIPSLGDDYPAGGSWYDAQEFITRLNSLTGKNYRLPTEAEWEYAARGGNQSRGYEYSGSDNVDDVAWHAGTTGAENPRPVGTKAPNELGIYDMSGNVYEWCSDWYDIYSASAQTNPQGPESGTRRVARGGQYCYGIGPCRVAARFHTSPDNPVAGLRLVLP